MRIKRALLTPHPEHATEHAFYLNVSEDFSSDAEYLHLLGRVRRPRHRPPPTLPRATLKDVWSVTFLNLAGRAW